MKQLPFQEAFEIHINKKLLKIKLEWWPIRMDCM